MSHAYGRMCGTHRIPLSSSRCPEGCGSHGWANEPCSPDCPEYESPDKNSATSSRS